MASITVRLDKKKFQPIFDFLEKVNGGIKAAPSDVAGHCIFFAYDALTRKLKNGKTIIQAAFEIEGINEIDDFREAALDFEERYKKFLEEGFKIPNNR
jgi:hypothetical protein